MKKNHILCVSALIGSAIQFGFSAALAEYGNILMSVIISMFAAGFAFMAGLFLATEQNHYYEQKHIYNETLSEKEIKNQLNFLNHKRN